MHNKTAGFSSNLAEPSLAVLKYIKNVESGMPYALVGFCMEFRLLAKQQTNLSVRADSKVQELHKNETGVMFRDCHFRSYIKVADSSTEELENAQIHLH